MDNVVAGINETELGNLSLEILNSVDKLSELFDRIESCMNRLPTYYKGEPCTEILKVYQELRQFYPIIKNNIITYSDDFIALIRKMRTNDKYLIKLFQKHTDEMVHKAKTVGK